MIRRVLALLVSAVAAAALAAPAQAVTVGISDQKPDMFADPRFQHADLRYVRLVVGWDALGSDWQIAEIDAWMAAARAAGAVPLVTFGHSRTHRRSLPTPERFLYEFRRFRARYPWVREYATWNEANHCGEPTCHRESLVAAYYRKLKRECPGCRILAVELLDMPNMTGWAKRFQRALGYRPSRWGLHNYVDVNRLRTRSVHRLLRVTRGTIWLTETGGVVARRNRSKINFPQSTYHAARVTRFLFDRVVRISPRITRLYLYHWNAVVPNATWDSGLIGPGGQTRPAFRVLEGQLRRIRAADARRRAPWASIRVRRSALP